MSLFDKAAWVRSPDIFCCLDIWGRLNRRWKYNCDDRDDVHITYIHTLPPCPSECDPKPEQAKPNPHQFAFLTNQSELASYMKFVMLNSLLPLPSRA